MILVILLRFLLAAMLGNTINSHAAYDDAWFVNASYLRDYLGSESPWSMIKNPSFFLFLGFVRLSRLPFWFWTSLLWSAAAGLTWPILRRFTKNRILLSAGFIFLLFCPIAFDYRAGLKIYRAAFMAPWLCLFFESCLLLAFECWNNRKISLARFLLALFLMSLTYPAALLAKEDGIWLVCVLGFTVLLCLAGLIFQMFRSSRQNRALGLGQAGSAFLKVLMAASLLLPWGAGRLAEQQIREMNHKAFGVDLINWRTQGEIAKFASLVYQIDSDSRTKDYWAATDALNRAIEVSKTLQSRPALVDKIHHSSFYNLDEEQIAGDFLPWVILSAYQLSGEWTGGADAQTFFAAVNQEIEDAFDQGTLARQKGRFFLTHSAGSRSFEEILQLGPYIRTTLQGSIFLDGYKTSGKPSISDDERTFERARQTTHENLFDEAEKNEHPYLWKNRTFANRISEGIFWFYRIANPLLLGAGFLFWCCQLICWIMKRRTDYSVACLLIAIFCLLGIWFVYIAAVSWFSEFIFREDGITDWAKSILAFYSAGGLTLQYLAELLAAVLIFRTAKAFRKKPAANSNLTGKIKSGV